MSSNELDILTIAVVGEVQKAMTFNVHNIVHNNTIREAHGAKGHSVQMVLLCYFVNESGKWVVWKIFEIG